MTQIGVVWIEAPEHTHVCPHCMLKYTCIGEKVYENKPNICWYPDAEKMYCPFCMELLRRRKSSTKD